jgi:hypothetical protein
LFPLSTELSGILFEAKIAKGLVQPLHDTGMGVTLGLSASLNFRQELLKAFDLGLTSKHVGLQVHIEELRYTFRFQVDQVVYLSEETLSKFPEYFALAELAECRCHLYVVVEGHIVLLVFTEQLFPDHSLVLNGRDGSFTESFSATQHVWRVFFGEQSHRLLLLLGGNCFRTVNFLHNFVEVGSFQAPSQNVFLVIHEFTSFQALNEESSVSLRFGKAKQTVNKHLLSWICSENSRLEKRKSSVKKLLVVFSLTLNGHVFSNQGGNNGLEKVVENFLSILVGKVLCDKLEYTTSSSLASSDHIKEDVVDLLAW